MAITAPILSQFVALLGPKGYCDDPEVLAPWLVDWRNLYHGQTLAMLSPESTQQVMAIMALARDAGIPLVPQGGNTSMVGGATPPGDWFCSAAVHAPDEPDQKCRC